MSEIPVKIDFFIEIYHENVLNSSKYMFDDYSEEAFQMDNIRSVFMKCIKIKFVLIYMYIGLIQH